MKLLYLYSFIIILFFNCKKKNEHPTVYVGQETKKFCVFKPGTYWVYLNTSSNRLDTWKVTSIEGHIVSDPKKNYENYELITLDITSMYNDTFNLISSFNSCMFWTNKYYGLMQMVYYENGLTEATVCDNNKLMLLKKVFDVTDSTKCVYREFKMEPVPCSNLFPYHVKWDIHRGLTEMVLPNLDTLKMVDYHIIQ